jgi:predicted enzyme related to lactoylglutathione lyase
MTTSEIKVHRTNTILYCEAFETTVRFYRDQLKLPITAQKDWFVEFRLNDRAFMSIADAGCTTIPAGSGAGITLSWQVEDVRAMRYRLVDIGIEATPVEWKWGAWVTYFRDPVGNRIELWS